MRILSPLFAILALVGCSDAGEHPPVISSGTGVHSPVDRSGLATPRNTDEDEDAAEATQALTNCPEPRSFPRTMTNTVITQTTPVNPAVCPAAWYTSYDPTIWRMGHQSTASSVPESPSGSGQFCQWDGSQQWPMRTGASTYDSCRIWQNFICPNGVKYSAVLTAKGTAGVGLDGVWTKAQLSVLGTDLDGSCRRSALADFNITGVSQ